MAVLQTAPTVGLDACGTCGVTSASRLPTDTALDDYYGSYYASAPSTHNGNKVRFASPERLASHIYRGIAERPTEARILDFGGGDGTIAVALGRRLKQDGVDDIHVDVVDCVDHVTSSDKDDIPVGFLGDASLAASGSYQMVLASASLEHVPEPANDLRHLLRCVAPGGVFYARTPFVVPILRIMHALHIPMEFGYPGHLHDMGDKFWNRILDVLELRQEFQVLKSRPSLTQYTFRENPAWALIAGALKGPRHVLGAAWPYVGGWEVFLKRTQPSAMSSTPKTTQRKNASGATGPRSRVAA